jgi:UDP-N-acetylmuramoylalanine--D-glutamate ligase
LICGWFDKWWDDFQELKPEFENVVSYCCIIWETAHYFKDICEEKKIEYKIHDSLQNAVDNALEIAKKNQIKIILFSPWCASFGMFKNFEERAKIFVEIIDKT